jgi:hypothetical protein
MQTGTAWWRTHIMLKLSQLALKPDVGRAGAALGAACRYRWGQAARREAGDRPACGGMAAGLLGWRSSKVARYAAFLT